MVTLPDWEPRASVTGLSVARWDSGESGGSWGYVRPVSPILMELCVWEMGIVESVTVRSCHTCDTFRDEINFLVKLLSLPDTVTGVTESHHYRWSVIVTAPISGHSFLQNCKMLIKVMCTCKLFCPTCLSLSTYYGETLDKWPPGSLTSWPKRYRLQTNKP